MADLYLVTYAPIAETQEGRDACEYYDILPFVDGSVRREPDLEHTFPSITCICRGKQFAPRLKVADRIIYVTRKRKLGGDEAHRRLTAVLEVLTTLPTHEAAAAWYRERNLTLPSNCMIDGNPPLPVSMTHKINEHRIADEGAWTKTWDTGYRVRARRCGTFVICKPLWIDLTWNAPVVHDELLKDVFGAVPGTRNPGRLDLKRLTVLLERLGLRVPPSAP